MVKNTPFAHLECVEKNGERYDSEGDPQQAPVLVGGQQLRVFPEVAVYPALEWRLEGALAVTPMPDAEGYYVKKSLFNPTPRTLLAERKLILSNALFECISKIHLIIQNLLICYIDGISSTKVTYLCYFLRSMPSVLYSTCTCRPVRTRHTPSYSRTCTCRAHWPSGRGHVHTGCTSWRRARGGMASDRKVILCFHMKSSST